ncbi:DUF1269 domain-containing protein [Virgisporangium aurantiacum]|uniref:DUF1269 domain-containing protein n=1 Tax=Virgisporangium aurantiacum TaxID=175570 RepID=UPI0019518C8C|nr:DUF1269 domain-containing protein [Virgisporangium aurantiacum]
MRLSSQLEQPVQDRVKPGTSALFMIVNKAPSDKTMAALSRCGTPHCGSTR